MANALCSAGCLRYSVRARQSDSYISWSSVFITNTIARYSKFKNMLFFFFLFTTVLLSEVSGSLANYFPSSQGDAGLPGTPGLPVSSRHFIYISLHDLDVEEIPKESDILKRAQAGRALKWLDGVLLNITAGCLNARTVSAKGRCKDWNQQRDGET